MLRWCRLDATSACSSTACRYKSASRSALSRCLLRSGNGSMSGKANKLGVAAASWAAAGAGGVVAVNASSEHELDAAFATLVEQRAGALVIGTDALFNSLNQQL